MLSRRTILLKPMQPGLSGYARLQTEGGKMFLMLHARGMKPAEEVRLYRCISGHAMQEAAVACANAHGEISAATEDESDPDLLQALVVVSTGSDPRPLLAGVLHGTLPDAKAAAFALCERLKHPPGSQPQAMEKAADHEPAKEAVKAERKAVPLPVLPREVFLPAIDPSPYAQAAENSQKETMLPPPKRTAPAVDRLKPLKWPRGFESLKPYFQNALPTALFDLPGWRFVYAAHAGGPGGLWLGMLRVDGRVCGVAYAHRGSAPQKGFHPIRGLDGQPYQIMIQHI